MNHSKPPDFDPDPIDDAAVDECMAKVFLVPASAQVAATQRKLVRLALALREQCKRDGRPLEAAGAMLSSLRMAFGSPGRSLPDDDPLRETFEANFARLVSVITDERT
jgi:hypothetical protein